MKIKILIPIIILSLLLISKPVFAKQDKVAKNNPITTTITPTKKSKEEKMQFAYQAIKNGLEKRHTALLKIKDKIQARIDKNPMKKNLSTAKTELAKFAAAEAAYQADLATLKTDFDEFKSAESKDLFKNVKSTVSLIRADLNAIKKILTNTVTALAKAPKLEVTKTK